MNADELKRILADHALWLGEDGGKRADLSYANLSGADLSGTNLRWAHLIEANLRWAHLIEADLRGAKLSEADLRGADLSKANLIEADLSYANLSYANLIEVDGLNYAQCSFASHGETGRQLSGVVIAGKLMFFCGCFQGTLAELDAYIENGKECYKATRKLARDFIVAAIDAARKEQP